MKKLSLDDAWKYCVDGMWKWIDEQLEDDPTLEFSIYDLKNEWMKAHPDLKSDSHSNCFFCGYDNENYTRRICSNCPAKLIDENFGCCKEEYHFSREPRKFYRELLRLKVIRNIQGQQETIKEKRGEKER